jgi:glutathione S-transferase
MKLYYTPEACSMASHICLEETGAPYESHAVDMSVTEQRSPAYLEINKRGQVPVLVVDGQVLLENLAIQNYIAKSFPKAKLAPTDALGESRWLSTLAWISNSVHPSAKRISRTYYFTTDPNGYEAIRAAARETFWQCLSEIDQTLENDKWMLGEQYTTADPYALAFFSAGKRFGFPVRDLQHYGRWKQRMLERPAVQTVLKREQSVLLEAD